MLLSPREDISYLVSWQQTDDFLSLSDFGIDVRHALSVLENRNDVMLVPTHSKGLSKNRNCALQHATSDLLVIADDDSSYSEENILHIREAFRRHPDASIIQFQAQDLEGKLLYKYPPHAYEYAAAPRGAFVSSCELVVRRSSHIPVFDERFGIGTYLGCGEEEVWVHRAHQAGLKIYYEPLSLVKTDASTTGTLFRSSPAVQRAKGGVLSVMHGPLSAALRCFKFVFFLSDMEFRQKLSCFVQTLKGIHYEFYTRHTLL